MQELYNALLQFRENVTIDKTGKNTFHNNARYHTIDDLMAGLQQTASYGIGWHQHFDENNLITTITHLSSGEYISSTVHIGDYSDAQKWAGAVTYKRRISLVTMFGLAEPDADGNQTMDTPTHQYKKPNAPVQDFDYDGNPYRIFKDANTIKATFSDIKTWGAAMKQHLRLNGDKAANKPEIERIQREVENDAAMHHKTKQALLKSIGGLLEQGDA